VEILCETSGAILRDGIAIMTNTDADDATETPLDGKRLAFGVEEFAGLIGVSRAFLFEEIRQARIKVIRRRRRTLITTEAAKAYLAD
jgi:hypothetical protein